MTATWLAGTRRNCTRGSSGSGAVATVTPLGSTNCTRMPPGDGGLGHRARSSPCFTGAAVCVTGAVIANFLSPLFLPKM